MKVFVGISGGVDSSVTAALLKDQGCDVTGVYMKNWTKDFQGVPCPWREDLADARAVAARLDIPFEVFDFEQDYKQRVVDYMVAEYRDGRTPNPDVMCNQEIKFNLFLETALDNGADMIATGHYARSENGRLLAGTDSGKDQSYFLYRITKSALEKSLMPLGKMHKTEVRSLAQQYKLPTAAKPDSQGICFVGEVGIREFLGEYLETSPGPVILKRTSEVLGRHDGAELYTIGQRHGLGIGGGRPLFVVGKDMASNTVYVTDNTDDLELHTDNFKFGDLHWIDEEPSSDKTYGIRVRYRSALVPGKIKRDGGEYIVQLDAPERAVAPGQSAVIYDGDLVLGGGIIRP